jgi:hypothetical protein
MREGLLHYFTNDEVVFDGINSFTNGAILHAQDCSMPLFKLFSNLWDKIYHFYHFSEHSSVAISTFTLLCSHHHLPSPGHLQLPKLKLTNLTIRSAQI